ncbi:hypothetical protein B188_13910 [Candidatus Brocadiaceae bacterium B188]|nr:hypothetical protein B188_13910 [Candidatus Brocadiaceae bacterium B188]
MIQASPPHPAVLHQNCNESKHGFAERFLVKKFVTMGLLKNSYLSLQLTCNINCANGFSVAKTFFTIAPLLCKNHWTHCLNNNFFIKAAPTTALYVRLNPSLSSMSFFGCYFSLLCHILQSNRRIAFSWLLFLKYLDCIRIFILFKRVARQPKT